jgi:hypothetical protein
MEPGVRVSNIEINTRDEWTELAGLVDDFKLWYRFPPDRKVAPRGDAFLTAALLPAMRTGTPLEIDPAAPVSPRLLASVDVLQEIFSSWYPYLHKVAVRAVAAPAEPLNAGVASFFSGGVDGSYTFLKHEQEITHLLFAKGIDMQLSNDGLFDQALQANREFLEARGKQLVALETNVRFLGHAYPPLNWLICHGGGLASIALALGFQRVYIAATHTYAELFPWGSHPLTDQHWSTEGTELVHDGAEARRSEKLERLGSFRDALQILRVCWHDAGYNCGRCEKCMRTMVGLRALKLSAPTFPTLSLKDVARLRVEDDNELTFFKDNLDRAAQGGDEPLRRALVKCVRRYERRKAVGEADRTLFGGLLRRCLGRRTR